MREAREAIGLFIGAQILSRRQALRWSQTDLGDQAGVTRQAVNQWEKGLLPSFESLYLVAKAFGCEAFDLLPAVRQVR